MATNEMVYRPVNWKVTYDQLGDGSTKTREWVELTRPGDQYRSSTWVEITPKSRMREGWDKIEPFYEAWKKGQEAPVTGTPLGAWPGITAEEAAAFKAVGLQSVEDVSNMTDRVRSMVRLPNISRLKEEAVMFLKAKDQRGVELQLKSQAEEIAALKAMIAEQKGEVVEAPKRRGRPPKTVAEALEPVGDGDTLEDEAA